MYDYLRLVHKYWIEKRRQTHYKKKSRQKYKERKQLQGCSQQGSLNDVINFFEEFINFIGYALYLARLIDLIMCVCYISCCVF